MKKIKRTHAFIWFATGVFFLGALKITLIGYDHFNKKPLHWVTTTAEAKVKQVYRDEARGRTFVTYDNSRSEENGEDHIKKHSSVRKVGNYYVTSRYKYKELSNEYGALDGKNTVDVDYYYLDCYILKDNHLSLSKTIDLKKLVQDTDTNLFPINDRSVQVDDKTTYYVTRTYSKKTGNYYEYDESIYADIENESVRLIGADKPIIANDFDLLKNTSFQDKLYEMGLSTSGNQVGEITINLVSDEVNTEKRLELAKKDEDVQVEQFYTNNSKTIDTVIFFDDALTIEEIAKQFLPEGQNLFDELTIQPDRSIDEQTHPIDSREAFQKWYKYSEENIETTLKEQQKK